MLRRFTLATVLLGLMTAVPAMAQTRVGVVNMGQVWNSMQEINDFKAKQEADANSLKSSFQAHQAELNNLKQQRDNGPKPDTQQYDDMTQQLAQKQVQYEQELKLKQIDMARVTTRQLKLIFDKIEAATSDIAKQKGLDIVITEVRAEFPKNAQDLTPEAITQVINSRNLLYVSDKVDITSEVTAALDAKYKSGGK